MFYLKVLFGHFKVHPLNMLFILAAPWLLSLSFLKLPYAINLISKNLEMFGNSTHITLICNDNEQAKLLEEKSMDLPLVKKIERHSISKMQGAIQQTLSDLELQSFNKDSLSSLVGMKIIFDNKFDERSLNLIKDYFNRISGTKEIIWGPFVKNDNKEAGQYLDYLNLASFGVLLALFYLSWLFMFAPLKQLLIESSFIIQRYQRTANVYSKLMFFYILFMSFAIIPLIDHFYKTTFFIIFILLASVSVLEVKLPWKKA